MPRTVAFCTLGCKVNQYDSEAMLELFERAGYVSAPFSDVCDVYVINTCTVTGTGDQKSRQMIARSARKNPDAAIVVTGCMAQRAAESLLSPGVALVLGTQRRGEVVALLEAALAAGKPVVAVEPLAGARFEQLTIRKSEGKTRATLKIQEGCENRCAYCVIPSVRGPVRSRPLAHVRQEAARLSDAGFQEIVLTGIHLSSYGRDFGDDTGLLDAVRAACLPDGVVRVRLGSLEPGIVDDKFVTALWSMPKVCPQFMLALQSGSDGVLARMGRRYDTARYARAAEAVRRAFPDAALTTDVMVGFPGETDAEFLESLAFVEAMRFARIHVFPYSRREGTRAADMPGQISKAVREARAAEMIRLGARLEAAYIGSFLDREVEVLFETRVPDGAEGYTPEYVRVRADGTPGEIQSVRVTEAYADFAVGKTIK